MFHTLNRRLGLWRRLETDDGIGGKASDWVQVGLVRCRIFLPASTEGPRAQADVATHSHFAHFAPRADVRRGDELRDTDRGERYRVVAAAAPSAGDFWRAALELYQAEPGGP